MKTKECEVQYSLARFEQQRKLADNEATRSRTLSAQVSTFSQTETELRSQLNIYVEKFKQVRFPWEYFGRTSGIFTYPFHSYLRCVGISMSSHASS